MAALVSALGLKNLVIVAPSSGGKYAFPYLFKKDPPSVMAGFIPIAPHRTGDFADNYKDNQLPTLILSGAQDPKGPETRKDLVRLPNHKIATIDGAGHPCYKDKTEDFHKVLYNWFSDLSQ
jgi:abhydrolase domain-containing protein 14